jgi:diguanylate cyclase (GGDEF)-like protein/PAS domain S-box-containing protein/putative nucleotidyltransferase with HDIG domain
MLSLRSARGRAILASVVLVVLLAGMATLAVWRTHDIQQQHDALERTSRAAAAMERTHAQFRREQAAILSSLLFPDDPALLDEYHDAAASLEQDLSQARAAALAEGDADEVAALDDLTERIGQFNGQVHSALPGLLAASPETRLQLLTASRSEMWSETEAIVAGLQQLALEEQQQLASSRATADRAADTALWLLVGFGTAAFLAAAGTVAMLIVSVVRPLASLRASARAITAGDSEARARVSGPEEIVSLARDFNEMTDTLAAKTREYIDTANLTGDLIVKTDRDDKWTFVNDAACQFFGGSRQELLGTRFTDYVHPGDTASTAEAIQEAIENKQPIRGFVNRYVTPIGTRVVEWNAYPLFDEEDQFVGWQATGRDITERNQAEERLRESEEEWRSLAEYAPNIIVIADQDGTIQFVNRTVADITVEETIGKTVYDFVQPEYHDILKKSIDQVFQRGEVGTYEVVGTGPGGRASWYETQFGPIKRDGRVVAATLITTDTTDRKRAEEALRESEGKYRTLLSNLPQKIFFKDKTSVYVSCNDNYARDLHVLPDEIAGKTDYDFYPQELADKYRADDKRIMTSGKSEDIEERYLQDGQETFVQTVKTPVRDEEDNVIGILGIFWDICDRRKMEQEQERLRAELEIRAITDSLTGLYNHAHFFQRLGEEIERSSRYGRGFSILMMDIDNFKHYNDTHGHQAGDEALCLIADCIRTALRRSDIAFRYGGDEFTAILLHADSSRAQTIIKRMNRCVARRLKETGDPVAACLGLSTGVACFPADAGTADDLVRIADAALYDAKRSARARGALQREQATIEKLASPPEIADGKKQTALSVATRELAATPREPSVPDAPAELDLRTIAAVGAAAEIKDPHIRRHQERVSQWAAALAEQMGLPSEQVQDIRIASLLHDLGKVSVSEHILNKPSKLTQEEFAKIKEHSALGAMIVAQVDGLRRLVKIIRHHHERFDGKGYPDGLARREIPLEARILAVADVFDAMTHERSYRKALTRAEAVAELERGAGTQFDPGVVRAFLTLLKSQGEEPAAPAKATARDRQLTTAKAGARRKG